MFCHTCFEGCSVAPLLLCLSHMLRRLFFCTAGVRRIDVLRFSRPQREFACCVCVCVFSNALLSLTTYPPMGWGGSVGDFFFSHLFRKRKIRTCVCVTFFFLYSHFLVDSGLFSQRCTASFIWSFTWCVWIWIIQYYLYLRRTKTRSSCVTKPPRMRPCRCIYRNVSIDWRPE